VCKYPLACAMMNIAIRLALHFQLQPDSFKMPFNLADGSKPPVASSAARRSLVTCVAETEHAWGEIFSSALEVLDRLWEANSKLDGFNQLTGFNGLVDRAIAAVEEAMSSSIDGIETLKQRLRECKV